jgi:hypothetical protein
VAGRYSDLLGGALVTTSAYNANYPPANLCDGRGGRPFAFATPPTANVYISADLDRADSAGIRDGGFEAATLAAGGWTATQNGASNLASIDATKHNSGSQSAKLHVPTAGVGAYAQVTKVFANVPSSSRQVVSVAQLGDGTVYSRARLFCPDTNQYLKSDGTWNAAGAAAADFATAKTTPAWTVTTLPFTMPSFLASGRPLLSLWLIAIATEPTNTGDAWVDDFRVWPSADFLAFHGHNLGPVTVGWYGSATGAFVGEQTTVNAAITAYENHFYDREVTPCDLRYQRIIFTGTNDAAIQIGSMTLSKAYTLAQKTDAPGYQTDRALTQTRAGNAGLVVIPQEQVARRRLTMPVKWHAQADRIEFLMEVVERSEYGRWPLWVVPLSTETDVLFGRIAAVLSDQRTYLPIWKAAQAVVVDEESYPIWI